MSDSNHRVLVVDDDDDIRANVADILREVGYDIVTAQDGNSALRCVEEQDFDVALLDYKMPGMDGATLYHKIKKRRPSIAAIMVTAYAGGDGAQRAVNAGTWDVLRKPVDIPELLARVADALASPLVLVVDDDESFCDSLWQILNGHRYRVALAHTEAEGVAQLEAHKCDVVMVDLKLGTGDGAGVIWKIQDAVPKARTILISGHHEDADALARKLGRDGIAAVCRKPLDIDQVLRVITGAVG